MDEITLNDALDGNFPTGDLTNRAIRRLFTLIIGTNLSTKDVLEWIKQIHKQNALEWPDSLDDKSVMQKLLNIKSWKNVKKTVASKEKYLSEIFNLPREKKRKTPQPRTTPKTKCRKTDTDLGAGPGQLALSSRYIPKYVDYTIKLKKKKIKELTLENKQLKRQCDSDLLKQENESFKKKLKKVRAQKRNMKRYITRERLAVRVVWEHKQQV